METRHTIYKLTIPEEEDLNFFIERIVGEYNATKQKKGKGNQFILSTPQKLKLNSINRTMVYVGEFSAPPEWSGFINTIAVVSKNLMNYNHSMLFIIETKYSIYAITTGIAHNVIKGFIDTTFGLTLLSKLIDQKENNVKSVTDKAFFGNRYGGSQFFSKEVQLITEKSMSRYFKEINSVLGKDTIEKNLGISINTKKKSYNVFAKDSFKVSKALNIKELDGLIGKIDELIYQSEDIRINDFYKISNRSDVYNKLNKMLNEKIGKFLNKKSGDNISFNIPLEIFSYDDSYLKSHLASMPILIDIDNKNLSMKVIDFYKEYKKLYKDKKEQELLYNFLKKNYLQNDSDEREFKYRLIELLECQINFKGKMYYYINGEWFLFENTFIEKVNKSFKEKTEIIINKSSKSLVLKDWKDGIDEGEFNASHYSETKMVVLDKIFVRNIEICDILLIENDDIFLFHVKKGLAGDTRILCEQIIIAANAIQNYKEFGDVNLLKEYYNSILAKVKSKDLNEAGENFIKKIRSFEIFKDLFDSKNIHFVFAYSAKQNILNPNELKSTPAKVSMLELYERIKSFDFPLHIYKIKN